MARRWGDSAPSLSEAPQSLARPLENRIVRAFAVFPDSEGWIDLTHTVKSAMTKQDRNLVSRPDIYVASIRDFHPDLEKLFVTYKCGMREYQVCYKTTFVFPPSLASNTHAKMPDRVSVHSSDITRWVDITPLWRNFSGPAHDYYCGSEYETCFSDVVQYYHMNGDYHDIRIHLDFPHETIIIPVLKWGKLVPIKDALDNK